MKNDNKKTVIVGIFVLIGIIILAVGILTLGNQQKSFVRSFSVKAVFDDIGGLQVGNNVWYSGVKVGTVRKITFYGDSQVEIEMNIDAAIQDFIRKDSKATISSDGLIGNKIIVIYGGTNQSPRVEDQDRLEAVMPLDTDKMMETLQENNNNLVSITNDLKVLTGKIANGEGIVGAVLTDSLLVDDFKAIIKNLQQTAVNSNRLTADLSEFSANLDKEGTLMHALTNDTTIVSNLKSTSESLKATTEEAGVAAENFKSASEQLNMTDNAVGMLLNDPEFAGYLKGTMSGLDTSTTRVNESLEALRYHWLFRGAFRKKDKAERKAMERAAEEAATGND
ncbi:MAG TPA: MlaD family protein [Cyclobacteriaceae bacterium]|nr:MlaD family protein [Cyclobacteriaceae bacterium]